MLKTAWALVLAGVGTTASAQTMYRCGSVYQDRPCVADAPANKVLRHSGTPQPATAGPALDARCKRAGEDAQKIMWLREAGRTERQQLDAATNAAQRDLVAQVYARHGSTPEVRAAIEADCTQANERAAQAAGLIDAAQRLQGRPAATTAPPAPAAAADAAPAAAGGLTRKDEAAELAERRKMLCAEIGTRLAGLREQMRKGGSISEMEQMNQVRRDAERAAGDAGCK